MSRANVGDYKLLVTGSHRYTGSYANVVDVLEQYGRWATILVVGDANGVDEIARRWGMQKGLDVRRYFANWADYGASAGPIRNQQMINEEHDHITCSHKPCDKGPIDFGLAFPEEETSVGTWDMVDRLRTAGISHVVTFL